GMEASGLFYPRTAPTCGCDLLAWKDGAAAKRVLALALVELAVATALCCGVLRKLGLIDLGGVVLVSEGDCLCIRLLKLRGSGLRHGLHGCQRRAGGNNLKNECAAWY